MTDIVKKTKDILGERVQMKGDRKYDAKTIGKALKKYNLKPKQKIKVTNEVNGNTTALTLSRTGTDEKKLMQVFKDPNATQKQKDAIVAAYLFEQGKENASFLAELFISKGNHTRETHAFKKQMRFDYEMFADVFVRFLDDCGKELKSVKATPTALFDGKVAIDALHKLGERFDATSEMLMKRIQTLTEDRMREKGYGIYVSRDGVVYDTRSEEIKEKVAEDVESEKSETKDNG